MKTTFYGITTDDDGTVFTVFARVAFEDGSFVTLRYDPNVGWDEDPTLMRYFYGDVGTDAQEITPEFAQELIAESGGSVLDVEDVLS